MLPRFKSALPKKACGHGNVFNLRQCHGVTTACRHEWMLCGFPCVDVLTCLFVLACCLSCWLLPCYAISSVFSCMWSVFQARVRYFYDRISCEYLYMLNLYLKVPLLLYYCRIRACNSKNIQRSWKEKRKDRKINKRELILACHWSDRLRNRFSLHSTQTTCWFLFRVSLYPLRQQNLPLFRQDFDR